MLADYTTKPLCSLPWYSADSSSIISQVVWCSGVCIYGQVFTELAYCAYCEENVQAPGVVVLTRDTTDT